MELPCERIWWIDPGTILGGRYPGTPQETVHSEMLHQLLDFGVRLFINLQEPGERGHGGTPFPDYAPVLQKLAQTTGKQVEVVRYPIRDAGIPSVEQMHQILAILDTAVADEKRVYVHCWGGHGRTATVAGCWMIQRGAHPEEALARITRNRVHDAYLRSRRAPEMDSQVRFIRHWPARAKATVPPTLLSRRGVDRNPLPHPGTVADRLWGALLGLAIGDALGTTLEFRKPGSFTPLTDMVGGGPFGLQPGQWTDDTSLALCLAESLAERQGFDAHDQLQRYVRWWKEGYMSSTGNCFDIGIQTSSALEEFIQTRQMACGPTGPRCAGNGSLMRMAPVPMAFWRQPEVAIAWAAASSRTTHGHTECVDACRYFSGLLVGAIQGEAKEQLLTPHYAPRPATWLDAPLTPPIAKVAAGSFRHKTASEIRGSGYVTEALEAALWAFATTSSFEGAVLRAVNLGDDADTTGAICGQIAGAFYGASKIPARWREQLAHRELIQKLCRQLASLAETLGNERR